MRHAPSSPPPQQSPPTAVSFWTKAAAVAADIKLAHTIFALPFALLAAFLAPASRGRLPKISDLTLVLAAMFLARTAAMTFNRWADAKLDAANPRTARRAIPRGELSPTFMLATTLATSAAFILTTAGFWFINANPWPLILSPFVLAWLLTYSFTKRFTWLCHLFLGSALAISPLAASIAVEPAYLTTAPPYLLCAMVACWVAGFDIIYALQDLETDRRQALFSMPASLGPDRALWVSRALHLAAAAALVALAAVEPSLGPFFATAVALVCTLLILEHVLVWRSPARHLHTAFFTLNGLISLLLGAAGITDTLRAVL